MMRHMKVDFLHRIVLRRLLPPLVLVGLATAVFGVLFAHAEDTTTAPPVATSAPAAVSASSEPETGTLVLPKGFTEEMALRTYQEHLDSQTTIEGLIDGEIRRFDVLKREIDRDEARLRVSTLYHDGSHLNGWLRARLVEGTWYFRDITADGHIAEYYEPTEDYDVEVLNTLLAEQAPNQDLIKGLVTGVYTRVYVGEPEDGFQTTTLPLILAGPDKARATGNMICIHKIVGRDSLVFVARFESD